MKLSGLSIPLVHAARTPISHPNPTTCRTRAMASSALPRPYRFHVGASWAGKPAQPRSRRTVGQPFHKDSEIGRWRDHVLSRPNGGFGSHIGEDFFYVQEVRSSPCIVCIHLTHIIYTLDAQPVGRCPCPSPARTLAYPPALLAAFQGISLGVADGVGGWTDSGVDPSLFSQALMYHAHRYAKQGWAGEPEIDPTQEYEERQEVEGWELTPMECIDLAHGGVLRQREVLAGACVLSGSCALPDLDNRV